MCQSQKCYSLFLDLLSLRTDVRLRSWMILRLQMNCQPNCILKKSFSVGSAGQQQSSKHSKLHLLAARLNKINWRSSFASSSSQFFDRIIAFRKAGPEWPELATAIMVWFVRSLRLKFGDDHRNKGLFGFRMRNKILRRSEKIETRSEKHDFSDRNSPVYVIQ